MGVGKVISRAAIDFPFDNVNRAALTRALGGSMGPKLDAGKQTLEEEAPG
jgi:hypothetical protein